MADEKKKPQPGDRMTAEKEQINVLGRATMRYSDFIPAEAKGAPKPKKEEGG